MKLLKCDVFLCKLKSRFTTSGVTLSVHPSNRCSALVRRFWAQSIARSMGLEISIYASRASKQWRCKTLAVRPTALLVLQRINYTKWGVGEDTTNKMFIRSGIIMKILRQHLKNGLKTGYDFLFLFLDNVLIDSLSVLPILQPDDCLPSRQLSVKQFKKITRTSRFSHHFNNKPPQQANNKRQEYVCIRIVSRVVYSLFMIRKIEILSFYDYYFKIFFSCFWIYVWIF